MNIRDLQYYLHLSDSLNFTKTAEAFYVSQPSISIALKRLEDHFEATLIQRNRSAQSIQLTEAGKILYKQSHKILDILEQTKTEIDDVQADSVLLGILPTVGGYYLTRFLPELMKYTADLKLVEENNTMVMFDKLRNNNVSIAILSSSQPFFEEKWVKQYPLERFELSAYVNDDHPLYGCRSIDLTELVEYQLISLGSEFTEFDILNSLVSQHDFSMKNVSVTNDGQTLVSLTQSGVYVGLMTDLLAKNYPDLHRIELINAPLVYISLVINQETMVTKIQEQFNQDLIKLIQSIYN